RTLFRSLVVRFCRFCTRLLLLCTPRSLPLVRDDGRTVFRERDSPRVFPEGRTAPPDLRFSLRGVTASLLRVRLRGAVALLFRVAGRSARVVVLRLFAGLVVDRLPAARTSLALETRAGRADERELRSTFGRYKLTDRL